MIHSFLVEKERRRETSAGCRSRWWNVIIDRASDSSIHPSTMSTQEEEPLIRPGRGRTTTWNVINFLLMIFSSSTSSSSPTFSLIIICSPHQGCLRFTHAIASDPLTLSLITTYIFASAGRKKRCIKPRESSPLLHAFIIHRHRDPGSN